MLSILIPTYNYDCYDLVHELHRQALECNIPFEIIVADDCSTTPFQRNNNINNLTHSTYIKLEQNVGRSKIRNLLADKAKYQYLLFIDCDAEVCKKNFIQQYINLCTPNCCIIGGTAYDPKNNDPKYSLRLKYGREREANPKHTQRFTTFNFLIDKTLFNKVRFDETIKTYGHEDSLLGAQLKKLTSILNINNPLIHKGLDENPVFIKKTETATSNLYQLSQTALYNDLIDESFLLQTYEKIKRIHAIWIINFIFQITHKLITIQLTSKNPSLFLFDCYKIGYLCHIASQK